MDSLSWFLINHKSLSTLFSSACQSTACTLEEFQNGRFILKTLHMFFVHTALEKFENATITGHYGIFFLSETREENIMIIVNLSFSKSLVSQNIFYPNK